MRYLEFRQTFELYPVISVREIKKIYPYFDSRRLVEWQLKGYLIKMKRGFNCFMDKEKNEPFIHYVANKIYAPSYITLESALAFYNLIPEGVFTTTSLTTKYTTKYTNPIGNFEYRHIKPSLYFGYKLIEKNKVFIKIAEIEKAILDYFYMNKINDLESIKEMRFNSIQAKELINFEKLKIFQNRFNSNILAKRIKMFKKVIDA